MKRSSFSEKQIIAVLKEQETGMPMAKVRCRHGISSATLSKWRSKFGGREGSNAGRLRTLEQESTRLKKLLAEVMLDKVVLKDLASKNGNTRRQTGSHRLCS
ncbi:transposase [Qipengyuania flava]|jgi:putative transposase|nr:transposase [Qipengyuania flava]MBY5965940.1 transposase [Qipengyuania flava]MBY6012264.1 transposase [Qipengyuania flava]MBY6026706.1 transposase [Qipengyuania flava]